MNKKICAAGMGITCLLAACVNSPVALAGHKLKFYNEDQEALIEAESEQNETEAEIIETEDTSEKKDLRYPEEGNALSVRNQILKDREKMGEKWSIAIEDLSSGETCGYCAEQQMQSASVIKVFIMGAVYDRICYPSNEENKIPFQESSSGELRTLLENMIRVSDNDAANTVIKILGEGDAKRGEEVVNDFCEQYGFKQTHLGRLFLESNPTDDNYTSAGDCAQILAGIYKGTLVCKEASEKMLDILKGQNYQWKLPAGLPSGYSAANKTGEMPEGYGLGCIENDIAIVFGPEKDYVLAVLSNELAGRNQEAQNVIVQISSLTASLMK